MSIEEIPNQEGQAWRMRQQALETFRPQRGTYDNSRR